MLWDELGRMRMFATTARICGGDFHRNTSPSPMFFNDVFGRCSRFSAALGKCRREIDPIHRRLFAIDSYDQIYEAMHEAEKRVLGHS
jgi:hypothetical protein